MEADRLDHRTSPDDAAQLKQKTQANMDRINTAAASNFGSAAAAPASVGGAGQEPHTGPSMEVAHVLFMDIIGYSKLRMNQQAAAQIELQNIVNACAEVQQAKSERKFICRPTGDGMALLFFRDLVSPVRAALQIHQIMDQRAVAMRANIGADIKLRMGIHSGTIMMVEDLNAQSDAAGDGINIAQRVMDCGDEDHILLSSKVAESLLNADPWQNYLSDLGEVRVKHGVKVHLYRLHGRLDGQYYGAKGVPKKVEADQKARDAEIRKYTGTFFERNPGAKKQIAGFAILALLIGGPVYGWLKVPTFKKSVQAAYVSAMNPFKKDPKAAAKTAKSGGKNGGGAKTARSSSGGGRRVSRASAGGGGAVSEAQMVLVPELVGRTLDDAVSTAQAEGLRVAKSNKSGYNTQYGEGMVYEQSPGAGANVKAGTRVYVRISKGDPPDGTQAEVTTTDTDTDE
jgi:class 3 adenylate cyclase